MAEHVSPTQLARALNRAYIEGHLERIDDLIDEKAEVASYLSPGTVVRGRGAIIEASRRARERGVYDIRLNTVRDLSSSVAVGTGSVRYPIDEGHTIVQRRASWLWKFSDGRLVRVATFATEDDACSHFDPTIDDFELPDS